MYSHLEGKFCFDIRDLLFCNFQKETRIDLRFLHKVEVRAEYTTSF